MLLDELNEQFGIPGKISFREGAGGWPYAEINHPEAKAVVSIYGAHVLNFIPTGRADVLWNTSKSIFQKGKAIRGGIPLCWPWFGPHPSDATKPAHGFARISMWTIESTGITHTGDIQLTLQINASAKTEEFWPYAFSATLTITIGKALHVELAITNTGNEDFTYTDALHSYIHVGDASQITIEGLQGVSYYDYTDQNALKQQMEALTTIRKEENRRYVDTASTCIIHDPVLGRNIQVTKVGSNTTVVWNPWVETAKTFVDMQDEDYKTMICMEAANAFDETITLAPMKSHRLATSLSIL